MISHVTTLKTNAAFDYTVRSLKTLVTSLHQIKLSTAVWLQNCAIWSDWGFSTIDILQYTCTSKTLTPLGQGAVSIRKTVLPGMAIPMLKIRRPNGRLIFNMGIPIPGKDGLYIETGPCWHQQSQSMLVQVLNCPQQLLGRKFLPEPKLTYCQLDKLKNFSEISIKRQKFFFKKICLKMLSLKWRPFCPGFNVLNKHEARWALVRDHAQGSTNLTHYECMLVVQTQLEIIVGHAVILPQQILYVVDGSGINGSPALVLAVESGAEHRTTTYSDNTMGRHHSNNLSKLTQIQRHAWDRG